MTFFNATTETLLSKLAGGAILAPMSGVTDAGMRRSAQKFGATMVVSEMIASEHLVSGQSEAALRAEGCGIDVHVIQIAGCDAYWMAEGAKAAEAAGAAIIDINMGCPAKRVTNGWSGSALMRDLDHASRLIEATVSAVNVPVTLKTRLGWDLDCQNAPELARRAEALGVRMITIHGRTRNQFYKGHANWAAVARIRETTNLPLIVNGDIGDAEDARNAMTQSGADAIMVGRAAVGQPWLCGRISAALKGTIWREPTRDEKAKAATDHYEWLLSSMGRRQGSRHARKHVAAYLDFAAREGFGLEIRSKQAILTSDDPDFVQKALYASMTTEQARTCVAA